MYHLIAAAADPMIIPDSGDTGWLLASLLIGLTAIPGIIVAAMGASGSNNASRILGAAIAALTLSTLLYFLFGYTLVFDMEGSAWIGSRSHWMLNAMGTVREGTTVPETGFALFHLGFVLIAVTLLNASLAVRARPGWLLGFSGLWLLLVLTPIMRWTWGGGWLAAMGALDNAGGLVVFLVTATSALTASLLIGNSAVQPSAAPNDSLRLAGALLLLVGIMAMTGGSTLGASDNAAVAMLTMATAAMTGALTSAALNRSLAPGALANGMVAGVVASAVAGDGISVGAAWLTGFGAALAAHFGPRLMPQRWHAQAALGGIICAAIIGAWLFAVFLQFDFFGGSGYAEGMSMGSQLVAQTTAMLALVGWAVFGTLVCALMIGLIIPMRAED